MDDRPLVAILSGGASTRMGRPKADVEIVGTAMRRHVANAAEAAGFEWREIGPGGIEDRRPSHSGPLAGIEAALIEADGAVVIVAVDQPWVRPATLQALAQVKGIAAVPRDEHLQVTCAVYQPECLPAAQALLDKGPASVRSLFVTIQPEIVDPGVWRSWGEDGRSWFSADTADAITEGLKRYGPPATGTLRT